MPYELFYFFEQSLSVGATEVVVEYVGHCEVVEPFKVLLAHLCEADGA